MSLPVLSVFWGSFQMGFQLCIILLAHFLQTWEKSWRDSLSLWEWSLFTLCLWSFSILSKVLTCSMFSYVNKVWHAYCKGKILIMIIKVNRNWEWKSKSKGNDNENHFQHHACTYENTPKSVMCMYTYYGKFTKKKAF